MVQLGRPPKFCSPVVIATIPDNDNENQGSDATPDRTVASSMNNNKRNQMKVNQTHQKEYKRQHIFIFDPKSTEILSLRISSLEFRFVFQNVIY